MSSDTNSFRTNATLALMRSFNDYSEIQKGVAKDVAARVSHTRGSSRPMRPTPNPLNSINGTVLRSRAVPYTRSFNEENAAKLCEEAALNLRQGNAKKAQGPLQKALLLAYELVEHEYETKKNDERVSEMNRIAYTTLIDPPSQQSPQSTSILADMLRAAELRW